MIGQDGTPVYGPTAVYVAPTPSDPAEGPFVAPADVLLTDARYRSKQAATTEDPFVAVYGADVEFPKQRQVRRAGDDQEARRHAHRRDRPGRRLHRRTPTRSRRVGEKAPKVHTDTLESAKGDVSKIDTREPPSDMHEVDFADVVGKKPVALLFATPQLCASRVCGPVTDIELQMQSKYGDQMTFIHQEVYVDNDIDKGLREPLKQFNLPIEPWLFVVDKTGRSPPGSRARSACSSSRTPSSPACEARARGPRGGAGRRRAGARRRPRRTASSSASSCRSRSGCSRGRRRRCS